MYKNEHKLFTSVFLYISKSSFFFSFEDSGAAGAVTLKTEAFVQPRRDTVDSNRCEKSMSYVNLQRVPVSKQIKAKVECS